MDEVAALPATTPRGRAGAGNGAVHPVLVDSARARDVLGLEFRTLAVVFGDALASFREKGWLN